MFKKVLIIVLVTIVLLIAISYLFFQRQTPDIYPEYQIAKLEQKTININDRQLTVEIADEPHEQSRGLSGRDSLDENQGMLFVFKSLLTPSFWMKEMNFPIDIIWLDADKKIIGIEKNVSPDTFPQTFSPPSPVLYVLEVNSGWSDRNNVKVGGVISF
ncbi:MAG: DUF192 domain-containing protein [bacterium]|nr:DUF192 domain-containing protein [bacterium]